MQKTAFKIFGILMVALVFFTVKNVSAADETSFKATNIYYSRFRVWDGKDEPAPDGPETNTSRIFGGGSLSFYMYHVKTPVTDPCPNCRFWVKPILELDGIYFPSQKFAEYQMGVNGSLDVEAGVGQPGAHYVGGERVDFTLTNLPATVYGWFKVG